METLLIVLIALIVAVVLVAPRVLPRTSPLAAYLHRPLSWVSGPRSDLGPLIQALFNNLMSPARLTHFSRRYVIGARRWRVVAHPDDAAVLEPVLQAVEDDLNFGLERSRKDNRLVVELPISVIGVTADEEVPLGRPQMEPATTAPPRARDEQSPHTEWTPPPPAPDEAPTVRRSDPRAQPLPRRQPHRRHAAAAGAGAERGRPSLTVLWPLGLDLSPIDLPPEGMTLGRDSRLGNGCVDVTTVSREHAELRATDDGWEIVDLGSHNGTFVEGERAEDPRRLRHGDVIGLGRRVSFRFLAGESPFRPTVLADDDAMR